MRKETQLFQLAKDVYNAQLWKDFWDVDIIAIKLPKREEPLFVSIKGKGNEDKGLSVYRSLEELTGFFKIESKFVTNEIENTFENIQTKECLSLEFLKPEMIDKPDYQRVKRSGVSFKEDSVWPVFVDYKPSYYPDSLKSKEQSVIIELLKKLIETAENFRNKIDFYEENSPREILIRIYEDDKTYHDDIFVIPSAVYTNAADQLVERFPLKLTAFEMRRTEKLTMGTSVWEIDICFVPLPMLLSEEERPFFPKMIIAIDAKSEEILLAEFIQEKTEEVQRVFLQLMLQRGVKPPRVILCINRADQVIALLGAVMKSVGVEMTSVQKLPLITAFQTEMFLFFNEYSKNREKE